MPVCLSCFYVLVMLPLHHANGRSVCSASLMHDMFQRAILNGRLTVVFQRWFTRDVFNVTCCMMVAERSALSILQVLYIHIVFL
jgi:hypothetical protein